MLPYLTFSDPIDEGDDKPAQEEPDMSVFSQTRSRDFMLATLFLAGETLFMNTFIGTVSYQANNVATPQFAEKLVYAFAVIFPVGQVLCVPIVLVSLEKRVLASYIITAASGALFGLFEFLLKLHWSFLLVNFAVFSVWRSFLHCATYAFVAKKQVCYVIEYNFIQIWYSALWNFNRDIERCKRNCRFSTVWPCGHNDKRN